MSDFAWLVDYLDRLQDEHVVPREDGETPPLFPVRRLRLTAESWGTATRLASEVGCRHAGIWGDQEGEELVVRACFTLTGDYMVLETTVSLSHTVLDSQTPFFVGIDRMERTLRDMYGITFPDHPDDRRWYRHQAWQDKHFPLRNDFPLEGHAPKRAPADSDYPFVSVQGSGVYQIPVGPVHAGIIEPGHFRFHANGEDILSLEERLGYVHKGIEKIAVGRDPLTLAKLAGRVSGDSSVAHCWAACMAMERAVGISVPARALHIRAILAERERITNHLGDIGAICNDVGFAFMHMQCSRLRENWQRVNLEVFGHRLLMDCVVPGGVRSDLGETEIAALKQQKHNLIAELESLTPVLVDHPSLGDRLISTGVLSPDQAKQLGVTGYVGKASGIDYDLRRDHRYAPYDRFLMPSPCRTEGDVAARMQIRVEEIGHSLNMLTELLEELPEGPISMPWPETTRRCEGIGLLEGWRGEILSYVRLDDSGRVARFFPRDPSWFLWLALEQLVHGNIVPDFPVCNKSINGSYSGHDL